MATQLSGCTIINEKEELLLLWKKKQQHYELPGGKVDEGETLEETAKRECKEELGVEVIIEKYLGYENFTINGKELQSHKYLARIKEGQEPRINEPEKFEKLLWLPIKNYKQYALAPNVKTFCEKYLTGKYQL